MTRATAEGTASDIAVRVYPGAYRDSVSLMLLSREVSAMDGVTEALVGMGTDLNLESFTRMGAPLPSSVGPGDLVVAVRAAGEETREAALLRAEEGGTASPENRSAGGTGPQRPRTARTAAAMTPDGRPPTLALVSVPGRYAAAAAFEALDSGLDVMLFSDNVPVEHEIALKDAAARLGRLVMGPDCGTALVGGAGLGFANSVRLGPVGIVAASGTGAQHLMCLLDAAGIGVSHCLGVGGRDLSAEVAGRSTLRALDILEADPATERIVVISKPPAPEVAARIAARAAQLSTPVHTALLGAAGSDITAAADSVLAALGAEPAAWPSWLPDQPSLPRPGALRGLFCGGTLADEAMLIAAAELGPIASNIPLRPEWTLPADLRTRSHLVIDFGEDELTADRPHPMIDPVPREERLAAELADAECGVVLLDVLLGHASHPDPAAGIAKALRGARAAGSATPVVVALCGTERDPQNLAGQAEALRSAGAEIYLSNAAAARRAVELVAKGAQ